MRRLRPLVSMALPTAALLLGGIGCTSSLEMRQQVIAIDGQWRLGEMEKDSFAQMVEAVRGLGHQPTDEENSLAAIPDLLRLVLKNPSSLVRADALRSAWQLGSHLPAEELRVDELVRTDFNDRTKRLEVLVSDEATVTSPEALEMAGWLAHFHAPSDAPDIAVSVSEVVLSQALFRQDELGLTFRAEMNSSLRHALVLVTLHAASDPDAVVREEALQSARHLFPETALALVAGVIDRETDSAVVQAALDSLAELAPQLPPELVRQAVQPLAASTDVAVKQRIKSILAQTG